MNSRLSHGGDEILQGNLVQFKSDDLGVLGVVQIVVQTTLSLAKNIELFSNRHILDEDLPVLFCLDSATLFLLNCSINFSAVWKSCCQQAGILLHVHV